MALSDSQIIAFVLQTVLILWVLFLAIWVYSQSTTSSSLKYFSLTTIPTASVVGVVGIWLAMREK